MTLSGGRCGAIRGLATVVAAVVALTVCGAERVAAAAQVLTVTNAAASGTGSLSQAVATANNDNNNDAINFAIAGGASTITLAAPLTITGSMTITGPGANALAISGGNVFQVFVINSGVVTISGLTIENGENGSQSGVSGGAIYNGPAAMLTLTNSTVTGSYSANRGGGIANDGTLTLSGDTISGNGTLTSGGGIYNAGTLTVTNCTIVQNGASQNVRGQLVSGGGGGGIYNSGTLFITGSTVGNNSANNGGGIDNQNGTLTISNSTIVANEALFSSVTGQSVPVGGDGGGIFNVNPFTGATLINTTTQRH